MAQYSPIAPIHILTELLEQRQLSGYLLLLAHDVLAHPDEYQELEANMYEQKLETFIIMDNGVIERGTPAPLEDLLEAASLVDADVVVGPDVIGNYRSTKCLMIDQADIIREDYPIMFIPQGKDQFEIYACCEFYARTYDEVQDEKLQSYWGVPRWITNKMGSRRQTIEIIKEYDPYANIHLLGMSENLADDIMCSQLTGVMGIDSANPLVMAYNHKTIGFTGEFEHLDRGDYWTNCKTVTSLMQHNIEWVTRVVNG